MSTLNQHYTIPKKVSTEDDLDYYFLRQKGIEYIEQLGGKLWTDFNSHDPGITILEVLSYAITDLAMRIDLPIEDLLSSNSSGSFQDQFFKASEVLPTSPVTERDYRKLFIDIDGVNNCWLTIHDKNVFVNLLKQKTSYEKNEVFEFVKGDVDVEGPDWNIRGVNIEGPDWNIPDRNIEGPDAIIPEKPLSDFNKEYSFKGLYDIYVDYKDKSEKERINEEIRKRFHANRNLCEDLVHIKEIAEFAIKICCEIDIENTADEEKVHALVLNAIDLYFSPTINFYSIKAMLDKGYTSSQIFDGPILNNGFIDDKELDVAELRDEVRMSDIINIIMSIPGVKSIKTIAMGECSVNIDELDDWLICLKPYQKPVLCDQSVFNYSKGVLPVSLNQNKVNEYSQEFEELAQKSKLFASQNKVFVLSEGQQFNLSDYTSIQNDFPLTYGVGREGIIDKPTVERVAKAKQLKAYLAFFDQILASYFKHLEKVGDLLSVKGNLSQTFFSQVIKDNHGVKDIIDGYESFSDENLTKLLFGKQDNNIERRNKLLDHLLSRFAEQFSEYTFIMKAVYGSSTDEMVLRNKEAFLDDYKITSKYRGNAANFYKQLPQALWNTNNVSGTQKRIARLLGIRNYNRRNISRQKNIEIYQTDFGKYRWRLRDNSGNIILVSIENYCSDYSPNNDIYFLISKIIEIDVNDILDFFKKSSVNISEKVIIGNIQINRDEFGAYSFNVINPSAKMNEKEEDCPQEINKILLGTSQNTNDYILKDDVKLSIRNLVNFTKKYFSKYNFIKKIKDNQVKDIIDVSTHKNIEIYYNNEKEPRWRLLNDSKNIVLSATDFYESIDKLKSELSFTIHQILNTSKQKIIDAFKNPLIFDESLVIDNLEIKKTSTGKFFYVVINPQIQDDPIRIIASKKKYFKSQKELEESILELLSFSADKFESLKDSLVLKDKKPSNLDEYEPLFQHHKIQIETLNNSSNEQIFRWRLLDDNLRVILQSVKPYFDLSDLKTDLINSIYQVLQITDKEVDDIFAIDAQDKVKHVFLTNPLSGEYAYSIIDPNNANNEEFNFIATNRVLTEYSSQEELKKAIINLINFFKADFSEEGIFLIEHILLRPDVTKNNHSATSFLPIGNITCTSCEPVDQYSYRVSIFLPGYTFRFANTDFRNYVEKVIKETLPSHVLAKICWIGHRDSELVLKENNELVQFEDLYKAYLFKKTNLDQAQPIHELEEFINTFTQLSNIYPTGRLFDCSSESDESLSGNIILGKTNLGSL